MLPLLLHERDLLMMIIIISALDGRWPNSTEYNDDKCPMISPIALVKHDAIQLLQILDRLMQLLQHCINKAANHLNARREI